MSACETSRSWQALPWNIVQRIGYYVSNKDLRCRVASPDDKPGSEILTTRFLSLCKEWRSIVLPEVCKALAVIVNSKDAPVQLHYPLWGHTSMPPIESFHMVRSVTMSLDLLGLIDGDLLNGQNKHKHMRLEKATKLKIAIFKLGRNESAPGQITAEQKKNVKALAEYLRETMPAVRSISLSFFHITPEITSLIGFFISALEALFGIQVSIAINPSSISILDASAPISLTGHLTTIKCWWDGLYYLSKELILQNTESLEYMEIIFSHALDLNDLIEDSWGNPIVYPNMQKLRLVDSMLEDADYEPNTRNTMVQFPRLRYLMVDICYPFIDDVLFRGNQQTLKFLYIRPYPGVADILQEHHVFESNPYHSLYHVMAAPPVEEVEREMWPEERLELVLNISNVVQSLILEHLKTASCFINALPDHSHNLSNLCILSMRHTPITLENIAHMVRHLPMLHELHSEYQGLGKQLDMPQEQMPGYVLANYSVSCKLAIWEIWNDADEKQESLATACLLLSIACPSFANLVYVDPCYKTMLSFNQKLKSLGQTPAFAKYSKNISRILFKEM